MKAWKPVRRRMAPARYTNSLILSRNPGRPLLGSTGDLRKRVHGLRGSNTQECCWLPGEDWVVQDFQCLLITLN